MKSACAIFALGAAVLWGADPKPTAAERLGISFNPPKDPEIITVPAAAPGTIVMPRFEIKDSRLKLTRDDLPSPAEKLLEAKREYISPLYASTFGPLSQLAGYAMNFLTIFGGWHPNNAEATVLYVQDARLRNIREFDDLIDLERLADPKEANELARTRSVIFRLQQKEEGKFYRIDLQQHDHTEAR